MLIGRRGTSKAVAAALLAPALLCTLSGCIFTQDVVKPLPVTATTANGKPLKVKQAVKAHLDDGSVVLFHEGFLVEGGELRGAGEQYDLAREKRTQVGAVPLTRVAALEAYDRTAHPLTVVGIVGGVPLVAIGGMVLFVALFGSCPTVYSPSPAGEVLEAELFSHSIAKRFEGGDLDRLEAARPVDGVIRVRVANEALETHYADRLSLVAVDHPEGTEAFPTPGGLVALLGSTTPLRDARSRTGRPAGEAIARRDGAWYQTGPDLDREAAQRPTDDWLEGTVEVPPGAETITVAFRLRNTLLDTVLLYDVLLGSQGAGALAWLDHFDGNPLAAWRWYSWFNGRYALRVLLEEDGAFREVASVPVTGPIAWHQTAVSFPAPASRTARLRFVSLADNWQVDWVGVSLEQTPAPRVEETAAAAVSRPGGAPLAGAREALLDDDDGYLVTSPGEAYALAFPAAEAAAGRRRTWMLRSRGYYVEWLRGSWLTAARADAPAPEPGDAVIVEASRRWAGKREQFEREFFSTRVPTEARP